MSRSPYFYVERFNEKTNQYELEHPFVWNYKRTERIPADLFPYNGCHDLFSIVEKNGIGNDFPEMNGIHHGLPDDACPEIKTFYDNCCYEYEVGKIESRMFLPTARWFTYADMYIYWLKNPEVLDYEAMDSEDYINKKITTSNPIKLLKDRVDAFLEVTDGWDWENDYSLIRIVYWIN